MPEVLLTRSLLALMTGVLVSFLIELSLRPQPRPPWRRPASAICIHTALWLLVFVAEFATFRRPWFAAANVDALFLCLVLINNAKLAALREAFVFQDFEYFIDALRHPRLYFPFFGWWRVALALAVIIGAILAGMSLEPALTRVSGVPAFLALLASLAVLAVALLVAAHPRLPAVRHEPAEDLASFGLLASLWRYALDERRPLSLPMQPNFVARGAVAALRPDLVAIQSESFFDPRRIFTGVSPGVLAHFDALRTSAALHGRLRVEAWGANTVRTEFAFLSGIDPRALGVHRFNPHRRIARHGVPSVASYLRSLGYRTVCLHPYPGSFYRRDFVYPALGFDEFIDIRGFADAERAGPFVGDAAVAEHICGLLSASGRAQPLFVFAITMENHGPLHLETVMAGDVQRLCSAAPPAGCEDLIVYLRHLANADLMIGRLREYLEAAPGPAGLCFYGDHVPIMPAVYATLGAPDGATEFAAWIKGDAAAVAAPQELRAEQLSLLWLRQAGLMDRTGLDPGNTATPGA